MRPAWESSKLDVQRPPSKHSEIRLQTSQDSLKHLCPSPFPAKASLNSQCVENFPLLFVWSASMYRAVFVCLHVAGYCFPKFVCVGVFLQKNFL